VVERVAVVTDSTAHVPEAESLDVSIVPLRVLLGPRTAIDGVDVTAAEVTAALTAKVPVTTSRPTPEEFAAEYERRLVGGATHIVSIHLAAALSGTWESAVLAAQDFGHGTVRVVDSRSTAMGLGFAVQAAARRAAEGASAAQVQGAATYVVDRTRSYFYVDTLEYLRRGGRVGSASSLLATSLSVKPLLQMVEGQIVGLEKVRTSSKAIARLVQLTLGAVGAHAVDLAVHHVAAPARAELVADQLRAGVPELGELVVAELGPVLGVHLGPGALGTVIVQH
jgi:DegV family protein with EDD domain